MSKQVPWDVIPDNQGVVLTAGIKKLEIDAFEETNSSTGKYMIKATFKVLEPANEAGLLYFDQFVIGSDSDLGAEDPNTWAQAVGAKIFKQVVDKAAVPRKDSVEATCIAAKGCQVLADIDIEVETKNEKYKGKERNRARKWFRVGERPVGTVAMPNGAPAAAPAFQPAFRPGQA
jgi:hypothetical protein